MTLDSRGDFGSLASPAITFRLGIHSDGINLRHRGQCQNEAPLRWRYCFGTAPIAEVAVMHRIFPQLQWRTATSGRLWRGGGGDPKPVVGWSPSFSVVKVLWLDQPTDKTSAAVPQAQPPRTAWKVLDTGLGWNRVSLVGICACLLHGGTSAPGKGDNHDPQN